MFRSKARIDRTLLLKHIEQVKTGLPGVAWVRLDASAPGPLVCGRGDPVSDTDGRDRRTPCGTCKNVQLDALAQSRLCSTCLDIARLVAWWG